MNMIEFRDTLLGVTLTFLCNVGGSHILLWATLFKPVKGFLFRREGYLLDFKATLKAEETRRKFIDQNRLVIDDTVKMER